MSLNLLKSLKYIVQKSIFAVVEFNFTYKIHDYTLKNKLWLLQCFIGRSTLINKYLYTVKNKC